MTINQAEPQPRHRAEPIPIEALGTTTSELAIQTLWEAGLARWGTAFVAFAKLGLPALYADTCLEAFEDLYMGSVGDRDELFADYLDGMGWKAPVEQMRNQHFIPEHFLVWDREAVMSAYEEMMHIIEAGGRVHVFRR